MRGGHFRLYVSPIKIAALHAIFTVGIACASPLNIAAQTYDFITIAGSPGVSGTNDGFGAEARFNYPSELTVDGFGRVYVCDFQNHTIRKLESTNSQWLVTTIAGSARSLGWADGTNSDVRFDRPCGIEIDPHGNLFVAEVYNRLIRKITPAGTNWVVSTLAGKAGQTGSQNGTNDQARFFNPRGMGIDEGGNLYVADSANHTIRRIAPLGEDWVVTTPAGEWPYFGFLDETNEWAEFNTPFSVRAAPGGRLFVTEWGNHAVRQITRFGSDWVTTTVAGDGTPGAEDGPGSKARFSYPSGIDLDSAGNVYVTDQENHTIRKVEFTARGWSVGTVAGVPGQFGTNDGVGTDARFNKPWGIAVDISGNVFVADQRNHTIRLGVPRADSAPVLNIALVAGEIVISWPAESPGHQLETAASLSPGAAWTAITNGIVAEGSLLVLTNAPATATAFYRLRRP